jgi:hypothetical protein
MKSLFQIAFGQALYWLTDRSEKPPRYTLMWGFWGFVSLVVFGVSFDSGSDLLYYASLVSSILWGIVLLVFLLWEIVRKVDFLRFRNKTQEKDDPFWIKQLSSDRKLKPKN